MRAIAQTKPASSRHGDTYLVGLDTTATQSTLNN